MYQLVVGPDELAWTALDFPGVAVRVLHHDPATGGSTVTTRLAPGAVIPAHYHTRANETVFVVAGDFVEAGVSYGPGTFFAGAAGTPHGPHTTVGGCTVVTTFSAELDFVLV